MVMAKHKRVEVINRILEIGLIPVFYHGDFDVSVKIISACISGGAKVVEFTNRGDFAYQNFGKLVEHFSKKSPELILGAGSIIDPYTAALYIANGAEFIVGPIFNEEVARLCNKRKISYSPGCGTATEISKAEEMGVEICKIFPGASVGGPGFIKSILGPSPWTRIMPTGGVDVTKESISQWMEAGAACLGIGSKLISKELVQKGDYDTITKKVKDCIAWIKESKND